MTSKECNKQKKSITGECKLYLTVCIKLPSHLLVERLANLGFVINDVSIYATRGARNLWYHGTKLVVLDQNYL